MAKSSNFPTAEELAETKKMADAELKASIRSGETKLYTIPLGFHVLEGMIEGAKDPSAFLKEVVKLAHVQTLDPNAGTETVDEETKKELRRNRVSFDVKTNRLDKRTR